MARLPNQQAARTPLRQAARLPPPYNDKRRDRLPDCQTRVASRLPLCQATRLPDGLRGGNIYVRVYEKNKTRTLPGCPTARLSRLLDCVTARLPHCHSAEQSSCQIAWLRHSQYLWHGTPFSMCAPVIVFFAKVNEKTMLIIRFPQLGRYYHN